jgi:hypothetical protein
VTSPDAHGQTRTDLARQLSLLGDDEPAETPTTPEPPARTPDEWWRHAEAFLGGAA